MPSGTTGDVGRVEANAERSTSGGWSVPLESPRAAQRPRSQRSRGALLFRRRSRARPALTSARRPTGRAESTRRKRVGDRLHRVGCEASTHRRGDDRRDSAGVATRRSRRHGRGHQRPRDRGGRGRVRHGRVARRTVRPPAELRPRSGHRRARRRPRPSGRLRTDVLARRQRGVPRLLRRVRGDELDRRAQRAAPQVRGGPGAGHRLGARASRPPRSPARGVGEQWLVPSTSGRGRRLSPFSWSAYSSVRISRTFPSWHCRPVEIRAVADDHLRRSGKPTSRHSVITTGTSSRPRSTGNASSTRRAAAPSSGRSPGTPTGSPVSAHVCRRGGGGASRPPPHVDREHLDATGPAAPGHRRHADRCQPAPARHARLRRGGTRCRP